MHKNKFPEQSWDYRLVCISETRNLTISSLCYASGRTPLEYIIREKSDISEYFNLTFYDWVTYHENTGLGELSFKLIMFGIPIDEETRVLKKIK